MRRLPGISRPAQQRGMALLVLLALFLVGAAYMLASSLNKSSAALSVARADHNRDVMQQAKAALIAWSAARVLKSTTAIPGGLPCPDLVNKGVAPGSCGSTALLGRLPYQSLGIDDLRDASGERLWYALSSNFRNFTGTINGDTQGLAVTGLAPATNVVAVVFAPGMRLGTQNRSPDEVTCAANNNRNQPCNIAANYLEGVNGIVTTTNFLTATENLTDPVVANLFNDQLLAITQQDLLSAIEPLIAARIQQSIVLQYIYNSDPTLTDSGNVWSDTSTDRDRSRYFDAWGGFPFAAPFTNPGGSSFSGQAGTYEGLLPVADPSPYLWSSGSVAQTGGSGSVWGGSSCAPANSNADLQCNIWYWGAPNIRISGTVNNVGLSFVQLTQLGDVSCSACIIGSRSLSGSLNNSGAGIVTFNATLSNTGGWTNVAFAISNGSGSALLTSPLISTGDPNAGWFTTNNWNMDTYYAVSRGYSGANTNCNVTNPCLTVNNLPALYANPTTNARAILIFAGRSLSGTTRPNGILSDYLEGQNASTGDYTFEHALNKTTMVAGAPAAINDRVIVIAP